ncbi:proline rich signal peptide protein [Beggiatoa sp. PS]|nr:proline rich signal peptide protein [Beggiatoa sp. PS]
MNAKFDYGLTEVTLDALQNGVPLTMELTIRLEQNRRFLWDKEITTLKQRYELRYHALRRQYVVKYLNTDIEEFFLNLNDALNRLGNLTDFPLIDKHLIKKNRGSYWVYMQIYLDIESLPVPLRPIAYLSSQWRLSSSWYLCPLKP